MKMFDRKQVEDVNRMIGFYVAREHLANSNGACLHRHVL